jgi:hypothetical protein
MERKTHFESNVDVEAYFGEQAELWDEPKPEPAADLWEKMERARLFNEQVPRPLMHPIARPDLIRFADSMYQSRKLSWSGRE